MENAAKALEIAGGILIGVLILSVLIFGYNNMKSLPKTQEEILEAKQLKEYNLVWESYNKETLRGTDIISVINKAIDNNKKYEAQTSSDPYYINVKFTLKTELKETISTYELSDGRWQVEKNKTGDVSFDAKEYNLESNYEDIKNFVELGYDSQGNTIYTDKDGKYDNNKTFNERYEKGKYYIKNNVFVEFKRRNFKCTNISYNEYGRVNSLSFEEIENTTEI